MPITETTYDTHSAEERVSKTEVLYQNRVLKVRTFVANRNHSDTLDYSDWRSTSCTEALVYVGREAEFHDYALQSKVTKPVPLRQRFRWVDCTNIFVWRGSPARVPVVDVFAMLDGELLEDFSAWDAIVKEEERIASERAAAHKAAREKAEADAEKNRPV